MKVKFYTPADSAKNVANIIYIATRPGADRGDLEPEVPEAERDPAERSLDLEFGSAAGMVKHITERRGSHGLFDCDTGQTANMAAVCGEIADSKSIVWRNIVSLHQDDAERLGYTTKDTWAEALVRSKPDIAAAMGIKNDNFRMVAAFHEKEGHPHCHVSMWEIEPTRTRGVLSHGEIRDMRKAVMDVIFEKERARLYLEKNDIRDLLRDQVGRELTGMGLRRHLRQEKLEMESEHGGPPGLAPVLDDKTRAQLQGKLEALAQVMPGHGRAVLQYMPAEAKAIARETADGLLRLSGFADQAGRYQEIAQELAGTYTNQQDTLDKSRQNAYKDVRDRLAQQILKGAAEIQQIERAAGRGTEPKLEHEHEDYAGGGPGAGQRDNTRLSQSLYRYAWRAVDSEVYSLDPGQRQQLVMPDKSDQKIAGMTAGLERLAEILPDDIKSRPALAYMPEDVKAEAREFAGRMLDVGGYHSRLAELSPDAAQQVEDRVAEQALSLAAGLRPREIEGITMMVHDDRGAKAIECFRTAAPEFIRDDKEETAWTVETMYRSLTRLGVEKDDARQCATEWARGTDVDANSVIGKYETKMAIRAERSGQDEGEQKEPPVISRRDWARLAQNLNVQDEKLLYPWYGVMQQPEQQPEAEKEKVIDIPHHLDETRIPGAVQALSLAAEKPADRVELEWTVRAYAAALQALGVNGTERAETICNWAKTAGVDIPEAKLRDISDRLSLPVMHRGDYWLGRQGWERLTQNLGIQAESPWVVEHTRSTASVVKDVWKGAFRAVERERQKAEARGKMEKMKDARKQERKEKQHQHGRDQGEEKEER